MNIEEKNSLHFYLSLRFQLLDLYTLCFINEDILMQESFMQSKIKLVHFQERLNHIELHPM